MSSQTEEEMIHISVKFINGKSLNISVTDSTRIINVKNFIHEQHGLPTSDQRLMHEKTELDDNKTISDYNIKDGSTFYCLIRIKDKLKETGKGKVVIKVRTGQTFTLDIAASDTIHTLKQNINKTWGRGNLDPSELILKFADLKPRNDLSITDYNIRDGCTLHLEWSRSSLMQIVIRHETGSFPIYVHPFDTFQFVKDLISRQIKLDLDQSDYHLIYANSKLNDNDTFFDHFIKDGGTIDISLRTQKMTIEINYQGRTFSLDVDATDTIRSVKSKIYDKSEFEVGRQCLTCDDDLTEFENGRTLSSYNIKEGYTMYLSVCSPPPVTNVIHITIKAKNNRVMLLPAGYSDTIYNIKTQIALEWGHPTHHQILRRVKPHSILDYKDEHTVSYCNIKDGDIVHLVLELPPVRIIVRNSWKDDEDISLDVPPSSTVLDFRRMIHDEIGGCFPSEYHMIFMGHLLDDSKALTHYNVQDGDFVVLVRKLPTDSKIKITFTDEVVGGGASTMDVELDWGMNIVLKHYAMFVRNIDLERIQFFYGGVEVSKNSTISLGEFGLDNGDTIDVIIKEHEQIRISNIPSLTIKLVAPGRGVEHVVKIGRNTILRRIFVAYAEMHNTPVDFFTFRYNGNAIPMCDGAQETPISIGIKERETITCELTTYAVPRDKQFKRLTHCLTSLGLTDALSFKGCNSLDEELEVIKKAYYKCVRMYHTVSTIFL